MQQIADKKIIVSVFNLIWSTLVQGQFSSSLNLLNCSHIMKLLLAIFLLKRICKLCNCASEEPGFVPASMF